MNKKFKKHLYFIIGLVFFVPYVYCQEKDASPQPYIDSLKEKNGIPNNSGKSWPPESTPANSPEALSDTKDSDQTSPQPYIDQLKQQEEISDSDNGVEPHIQSLREGKKLEPKYKKTVDQAAGFSIVTSSNYDFKSESFQANPFNDVYRTKEKYNPSVSFFYEKQLFRNYWSGVLGGYVKLMPIFLKGKGVFTKSKTTADSVKFTFVALPVSFGPSYRIVLAKLFVPFIQAGGIFIPFSESRNDNQKSHRGFAYGLEANGGISISLDWISHKNAWDIYDAQDILHTYLSLHYEFVQPLSQIKLSYRALYAGLTFEF